MVYTITAPTLFTHQAPRLKDIIHKYSDVNSTEWVNKFLPRFNDEVHKNDILIKNKDYIMFKNEMYDLFIGDVDIIPNRESVLGDLLD